MAGDGGISPEGSPSDHDLWVGLDADGYTMGSGPVRTSLALLHSTTRRLAGLPMPAGWSRHTRASMLGRALGPTLAALDEQARQGIDDALTFIHRLPPGAPLEAASLVGVHALCNGLAAPDVGRLRQEDVLVSTSDGGRTYVPPKPATHPALLRSVLEWWMRAEGRDPFVGAASLHLQLAALHPFTTGNDTLIRFLVATELTRAGIPLEAGLGVATRLQTAFAREQLGLALGREYGYGHLDTYRWLIVHLDAQVQHFRAVDRLLGDAEGRWAACDLLTRDLGEPTAANGLAVALDMALLTGELSLAAFAHEAGFDQEGGSRDSAIAGAAAALRVLSWDRPYLRLQEITGEHVWYARSPELAAAAESARTALAGAVSQWTSMPLAELDRPAGWSRYVQPPDRAKELDTGDAQEPDTDGAQSPDTDEAQEPPIDEVAPDMPSASRDLTMGNPPPVGSEPILTKRDRMIALARDLIPAARPPRQWPVEIQAMASARDLRLAADADFAETLLRTAAFRDAGRFLAAVVGTVAGERGALTPETLRAAHTRLFRDQPAVAGRCSTELTALAEDLAGASSTDDPLLGAALAERAVLLARPFPVGNEVMARLVANAFLARLGIPVELDVAGPAPKDLGSVNDVARWTEARSTVYEERLAGVVPVHGAARERWLAEEALGDDLDLPAFALVAVDIALVRGSVTFGQLRDAMTQSGYRDGEGALLGETLGSLVDLGLLESENAATGLRYSPTEALRSAPSRSAQSPVILDRVVIDYLRGVRRRRLLATSDPRTTGHRASADVPSQADAGNPPTAYQAEPSSPEPHGQTPRPAGDNGNLDPDQPLAPTTYNVRALLCQLIRANDRLVELLMPGGWPMDVRASMARRALMSTWPTRTRREQAGLVDALTYLRRLAPGAGVETSLIVALHALLYGRQSADAGRLRVQDAAVGWVGEIGAYAPPRAESIPALLQSLVEWWMSSDGLHPFVRAALLHLEFIAIHPFDTGNEGVARLLVAAELTRAGIPLDAGWGAVRSLSTPFGRRHLLRALQGAGEQSGREEILRWVLVHLDCQLRHFARVEGVLNEAARRWAVCDVLTSSDRRRGAEHRRAVALDLALLGRTVTTGTYSDALGIEEGTDRSMVVRKLRRDLHHLSGDPPYLSPVGGESDPRRYVFGPALARALESMPESVAAIADSWVPTRLATHECPGIGTVPQPSARLVSPPDLRPDRRGKPTVVERQIRAGIRLLLRRAQPPPHWLPAMRETALRRALQSADPGDVVASLLHSPGAREAVRLIAGAIGVPGMARPLTPEVLRAGHALAHRDHPAFAGRLRIGVSKLAAALRLVAAQPDPLVRAALAERVVLVMCPFVEGNELMARLLANTYLAELGVPPEFDIVGPAPSALGSDLLDASWLQARTAGYGARLVAIDENMTPARARWAAAETIAHEVGCPVRAASAVDIAILRGSVALPEYGATLGGGDDAPSAAAMRADLQRLLRAGFLEATGGPVYRIYVPTPLLRATAAVVEAGEAHHGTRILAPVATNQPSTAQEHWALAEAVVAQGQLPVRAAHVVALLVDGPASRADLGRDSATGDDSVGKYLAELRRQGLVTVGPRPNQRTALYRLLATTHQDPTSLLPRPLLDRVRTPRARREAARRPRTGSRDGTPPTLP